MEEAWEKVCVCGGGGGVLMVEEEEEDSAAILPKRVDQARFLYHIVSVVAVSPGSCLSVP